MVIKVYVSNCSGNMEIKKQQKRILEVLQAKHIDFEEIDISDPTLEEDKKFMRAHSVPKDGQRVPLPPQVFAEDDYCGDYDLFQDAAEFEELYEFLKLAPPKNVSTAAVTITEAHTQESAPDERDYGRNEDEEEEEEEEEKKEEEEEDKKDDYIEDDRQESEPEPVGYSQVTSTESKTEETEDDQGGYTISTTTTSVTRTTRQVGEDEDDDDVDRDDEASSSTHDYENVVISRDCDNNTVVQVKEDEAPVEENFPEEENVHANGNDNGYRDDDDERKDDDEKE